MNDYLGHDWEAFNGLGMSEQCQEWNQQQDKFIDHVKAEYAAGKFDFEKVYALIQSYSFENLPIEGKLHVVVNKFLLKKQLLELVQEIEFQEIRRRENPPCECELLSKFGKNPNIDKLKEIGVINDSYYMPKLLKCNTCGFLWNSYLSDDSTGQTVFEKHKPEDDDWVEYYS